MKGNEQLDESQTSRLLPPIASFVDRRLTELEQQIDWLPHLSPLDNDRMWQRFVQRGCLEEPKLHYPPLSVDPQRIRGELSELPLHDVEHPLLRALLAEKKGECELLSFLVELRDTEGALATSLELFGGTEAHLVRLAERILSSVPHEQHEEEMLGWESVVPVAQAMLDALRDRHPDLSARLILREDLNSNIMVHNGQLHVSKSILVARARLIPLLAHEIGTHVVTWENGAKQCLRTLRSGLAGYDETQEGLGVFAEYLAGYLPASRLRVLAARVLASKMAVERHSVVQIFWSLVENHRLLEHEAFDVAVRAKRGGGLTKDAIYLRGLHKLLEHLKSGGALSPLYLGKYSLAELPLVWELMELGWVLPPVILPEFLTRPEAEQRIQAAREKPLEQLFHLEPQKP